ncbi:hypothetical protein BV898_15889 [Hypsibius exemplaris]|uniref:Uncharacterized protein n=1 Tax=Hypsibius exemplaris TaxID=2072580 RepID=A0A9X6NER4_HYPEX|nr:hypothetical protein BV898_15889 [Hypsibius exemplaris]
MLTTLKRLLARVYAARSNDKMQIASEEFSKEVRFFAYWASVLSEESELRWYYGNELIGMTQAAAARNWMGLEMVLNAAKRHNFTTSNKRKTRQEALEVRQRWEASCSLIPVGIAKKSLNAIGKAYIALMLHTVAFRLLNGITTTPECATDSGCENSTSIPQATVCQLAMIMSCLYTLWIVFNRLFLHYGLSFLDPAEERQTLELSKFSGISTVSVLSVAADPTILDSFYRSLEAWVAAMPHDEASTVSQTRGRLRSLWMRLFAAFPPLKIMERDFKPPSWNSSTYTAVGKISATVEELEEIAYTNRFQATQYNGFKRSCINCSAFALLDLVRISENEEDGPSFQLTNSHQQRMLPMLEYAEDVYSRVDVNMRLVPLGFVALFGCPAMFLLQFWIHSARCVVPRTFATGRKPIEIVNEVSVKFQNCLLVSLRNGVNEVHKLALRGRWCYLAQISVLRSVSSISWFQKKFLCAIGRTSVALILHAISFILLNRLVANLRPTILQTKKFTWLALSKCQLNLRTAALYLLWMVFEQIFGRLFLDSS